MKNVLILNGPNLNLLGSREVSVYGKTSLDEINRNLVSSFPHLQFTFFQSNTEAELVDKVQTLTDFDGMIINPGALSHYSLKLMDAMHSFDKFIIEVHISNIFNRDEFRHTMLTAKAANMVICGSGPNVYKTAVGALIMGKE